MPNSYLEQTGADTLSVSALKYISIDHLKALGTTDTYSGSGADTRSWTILTIASRDAAAKTVTITGGASGYSSGTIRVYRSTPATQIIDFQSGARLTEYDLDTAYQQCLYVAQEVAENAGATVQPAVGISNIGAAHIAADGVVTAAIDDGAVTNDKLAGGITNANLAGAITNAKLAGGITNDKLYGGIDLATKVTGALPVANGGTGLASNAGRVLEQWLLPCDGISFTTHNSIYSLSAVTASVALTDTHADVVGSSISYTPPAGTQIVIYKFITSIYAGVAGVAHFKLYLDGTEVTDARTTVEFSDDAGRRTIEWALPIGGVASAATGRLASWSGAKIIKLQARRFSSDDDASLHAITNWDGSASAQFSRPQLGITAIG